MHVEKSYRDEWDDWDDLDLILSLVFTMVFHILVIFINLKTQQSQKKHIEKSQYLKN